MPVPGLSASDTTVPSAPAALSHWESKWLLCLSLARLCEALEDSESVLWNTGQCNRSASIFSSHSGLIYHGAVCTRLLLMKTEGKNEPKYMGVQQRQTEKDEQTEMETETENGEGQRVIEEFLDRDIIFF